MNKQLSSKVQYKQFITNTSHKRTVQTHITLHFCLCFETNNNDNNGDYYYNDIQLAILKKYGIT